MIKANDKNALGAFFQTKRIMAAYFRGNKIWEHTHAWSGGTCSTCGKTCSHSWGSLTTSGGTCSICGMTHTHTWNSNAYCSICGYDGAAKIYFDTNSRFNLTASENSISYDNTVIPVTSAGPYRIPPGQRAVTAKMYCSPPSNAIGVLKLSTQTIGGMMTGPSTQWGVASYLTCTPKQNDNSNFVYAVGGTYTFDVAFFYKS